ncbi:MAG: alcohol dehydrogenase catalytic domain-containing protein [Candidatus Latescibacteria bacterium]|nr:alcohol dehydrogenase catalytic domain-containing protein [Candidatus Latescibacterota bacterium]
METITKREATLEVRWRKRRGGGNLLAARLDLKPVEPTMYKATILTAPGDIEITSRDDIAPQPYEAVVLVRWCGVCGTDISLFDGRLQTSLPIVPGHEFEGIVSSVGDEVDLKWMGKRVTAEINNTCVVCHRDPVCPSCRYMPNHCNQRTVLGIDRADGVFAEQVADAGGVDTRLSGTVYWSS